MIMTCWNAQKKSPITLYLSLKYQRVNISRRSISERRKCADHEKSKSRSSEIKRPLSNQNPILENQNSMFQGNSVQNTTKKDVNFIKN